MGFFAIFSPIANALNSNNFADANFYIKRINDVEYYFTDLAPANYEIIATYGKLPVLQTEYQKRNWSNSLKEIIKSLDSDFSNYTYPNGKVIAHGENSRGYFVVVLYKNFTIEKELIDEIYRLIEAEARKSGIPEVPVEFGSGGFPVAKIDGRSEAEKKADEEFEKRLRGPREQPTVIATHGKLPELKTEEQKWKWTYKDQPAIIEGLKDKITPYFIPKGPLVVFGTDTDGYFRVVIHENLTVEKQLIDEIYGIIDEEAKKRGIHEVPVRFELGTLTPASLTADSSKSTPPPGNKSIPPDKTSGKPVLGFGLLSVLISIFSVWIIIRKVQQFRKSN